MTMDSICIVAINDIDSRLLPSVVLLTALRALGKKLMVKFNREALADAINSIDDPDVSSVTITVTDYFGR